MWLPVEFGSPALRDAQALVVLSSVAFEPPGQMSVQLFPDKQLKVSKGFQNVKSFSQHHLCFIANHLHKRSLMLLCDYKSDSKSRHTSKNEILTQHSCLQLNLWFNRLQFHWEVAGCHLFCWLSIHSFPSSRRSAVSGSTRLLCMFLWPKQYNNLPFKVLQWFCFVF